MTARTRRLSVASLAVLALACVWFFALREPAEADPVDRVEMIAERVEALRGLEFKRMPTVQRRTTRQLTREFEEELDGLPAGERGEVASSQELTALLGFTGRESDLTDAADATGIAGVYEHDSETLTIVTDAPGGRDERELTIAHELAHALEDQHFDLGRLMPEGADDDRLSAGRALAEGSAHLLEQRYARRHFDSGRSARAIASRAPASTVRGTAIYPANDSRFAYLDGARYVANLQQRGGLEAIDRAFRNPPATTAEILHPGERRDRAPVRLDLDGAVGAGFEPVMRGTFGEFDTGQLLVLGAATVDADSRRTAAEVASGWQGGRYELRRAGGTDDQGCSRPCVERNLLALAWQFDSPERAAAFVDGLDPYLDTLQQLDDQGDGVWTGNAVTVIARANGTGARLVFAPVRAIAERAAGPRPEPQ